MQIKALIIDDEPLARAVIIEFSKKIPSLFIENEFEDVLTANDYLKEKDIDLLFLDINMPKISGIEFLKTAKNLPEIILTTAYTEYALDAFEFSVVDYLKKPFSFERFCKAYFKAQEIIQLKKENSKVTAQVDLRDFVFIKSDKKIHKIRVSDIQYVEGLGDYIKIHTTTAKIVSNLSMKKILEFLPKAKFCRIHKSYIIAVDKIESMEGNLLKINNTKLPVGNNYKHDLIQFIQENLAE